MVSRGKLLIIAVRAQWPAVPGPVECFIALAEQMKNRAVRAVHIRAGNAAVLPGDGTHHPRKVAVPSGFPKKEDKNKRAKKQRDAL